jgi:hypothetical protein
VAESRVSAGTRLWWLQHNGLKKPWKMALATLRAEQAACFPRHQLPEVSPGIAFLWIIIRGPTGKFSPQSVPHCR